MHDDPDTAEVPYAIRSVWPALVLLGAGVVILVWAQSYEPLAARFPSLVAALLIGLGVLDVLGRTGLDLARIVQTIGGAGFANREMGYDPPIRQQWTLTGWVLAAFAGMAVFGILVWSPLYCVLFARFKGARSWTTAFVVGAVVFAFEYVVFELLLDYELYRGLILAKGGVTAW